MARPQSVVGIDLGRHTLKAVCLGRRGHDQHVLQDYAVRAIPEELSAPAELPAQLRMLLRDLDSAGKPCAIALSGIDPFLRIIQQPPTPPELLREGLRLNGMTLLNHDCQELVLDCCHTSATGIPVEIGEANPATGVRSINYLVAGMTRTRVTQILEAIAKNKARPLCIQPAPVALFNAFDFSCPDVSAGEAFVLLDIGHLESTVLVGARREIFLVRTIDFGGEPIAQVLTAQGAVDRKTALTLLNQGDTGLVPVLADSVSSLAREITTSIGFFEGQREDTIQRIFVSGGPIATDMLLQVLSDRLDLTCQVWDPFTRCVNQLRRKRNATLEGELANLPIAFGAALAALESPA